MVPSLFDENNDLISFLDYFERELDMEQQEEPLDLTIPRLDNCQRYRIDLHHGESCRDDLQAQRFVIQLPRECPSSSGTPPVTQECARGIPALLCEGQL
ncbi:hypothetical protein TNCV_4980131 [Trichonephila clavipes]|nr:hypothetical protein TNCV_4980131 [Trichonephila clavipes]